MITGGILMGHGQIRHVRLRPARHAFDYAAYFVMLPMRQLQTLLRDPAAVKALPFAINQAGLMSFHDVDHGDGRLPEQGGALAWLEALLAEAEVSDADGEIWLQTFPRVLGYTFKPVSFWYCHRQDNSLAAIVAEVHNTFGERHCYLLHEPKWGATACADKVFHVSPFCAVSGGYRFQSTRVGDMRRLSINYHDPLSVAQPLLRTAIVTKSDQFSTGALFRSLLSMPMMTFGVISNCCNVWAAPSVQIKKS